ncbi:nuclear transport factor 2 family protein [Dasania sp. GY-19]|uniref:Nuclear transport factor 2 family protein n=1 Tax=Dasania phycosphaerae TaxID=2950436 RepID=A0A9J6RR96_9GAMM|nr:nuclear transport factor 2 family protein [Dasania phycosphaerae]MCZ0866809.1 nuclear transport factor 2 family protein [Dasania phycosphaerae]
MKSLKSYTVVLAAIIVTIGTISVHADKSPPTNLNNFINVESAPGQIVNQFHQAFETGDIKTLRSHLADDVLIFEGGVERSAESYASHHMLADIQYYTGINSTTLEHRVTIGVDLAVSISRSKHVGAYKSEAVNNINFETVILRKVNDKWKITHIHWSS